MSDTFVPLIPLSGPGGGAGSTQMKVLSPAESKSAFAPLMAGAGAGNTHAPTCGQPKLTLQRQGDVISVIRVECGCGQVIELKCVY